MMGNIKTGNYMIERGSVKSKKQGTQDRTLGNRRHPRSYYQCNLVCGVHSAIHTEPIPEAVKKNIVVNSIK